MSDTPQYDETAPPGVSDSLWKRFLTHVRGDVAELEHDTSTPNEASEAPSEAATSVAPAEQPSTPDATPASTTDTPVVPDVTTVVPDPTAPSPAPPATVSVPGIGAMVVFRSEHGPAQYGQVVEHDTIEPGTAACCVAWVTGGVSGPIAADELEVTGDDGHGA